MPAITSSRATGFPGAISFDWVPDPEVLAAEILQIANYLENMQIPLQISQEILRADIRERFETETTPEGAKWVDWADSYRPVAEAYPNIGILRQEGEMAGVAEAESSWLVTHNAIFLNTGAWPRRWIWHQEGTGRGALFFKQGGRGKLLRGIPSPEDVRLTGPSGVGRGQALPPRPFVGPSFEAMLKVAETFEAWFEGGATFATKVPGAVAIGGGPVFRGAGGRFVSLKRFRV